MGVSEERAEGLTRRIRRAGAVTAFIRAGLVATVLGPIALWIGVGIVYSWANPRGPEVIRHTADEHVVAIQMTPTDWLATTPYAMGAGVCLAFLVALPTAYFYRRLCCARLRHLLGTCSGEERRDALLSLRDDRSGDIRRIVGPLVRHFHVEAEVVPAVAPAGTGSEPAADAPLSGTPQALR